MATFHRCIYDLSTHQTGERLNVAELKYWSGIGMV